MGRDGLDDGGGVLLVLGDKVKDREVEGLVLEVVLVVAEVLDELGAAVGSDIGVGVEERSVELRVRASRRKLQQRTRRAGTQGIRREGGTQEGCVWHRGPSLTTRQMHSHGWWM